MIKVVHVLFTKAMTFAIEKNHFCVEAVGLISDGITKSKRLEVFFRPRQDRWRRECNELKLVPRLYCMTKILRDNLFSS